MTWLTTTQAAEYLQVGKASLHRWRQHKGLPEGAKPPRVSAIGRVVRYRAEWLDEFMAQFEIDTGAELERRVDEIWQQMNRRDSPGNNQRSKTCTSTK